MADPKYAVDNDAVELARTHLMDAALRLGELYGQVYGVATAAPVYELNRQPVREVDAFNAALRELREAETPRCVSCGRAEPGPKAAS